MPTWRPRKRASASSSSRPMSSPATTTEPVSARSSPAMTISRVDLPEPDGPTRPTASPRPILSVMSLRMCTRAAPLPSERLTPASATAETEAELVEVSFMRLLQFHRGTAARWRWCGAIRSWEIDSMRAGIACRGIVVALACALAVWTGPAAAADKQLNIVALGDSLAAGYGLRNQDAFPAKLQQALAARGIAVNVANAGVSGDTMSGGLARLDWSVPLGTDAVILELGANDALRGLDPAVTRRALDAILAALAKRNIPVLLCGMLAPRNLGADYARAFDPMYA